MLTLAKTGYISFPVLMANGYGSCVDWKTKAYVLLYCILAGGCVANTN